MNDELYKALEKLDDSIRKEVPSTKEIQRILNNKQREHKRQLKQELGWFLIVSLIIISVILFTASNAPIIFLIGQISGILLAPSYIWIQRKKQDRGDVSI